MDGVPVNLVPLFTNLQEEALMNSQRVELRDGIHVHILSPEYVVMTKLLNNPVPRDIDDLIQLANYYQFIGQTFDHKLVSAVIQREFDREWTMARGWTLSATNAWYTWKDIQRFYV